MKKIVFITPDDADPGFRLTGAEQIIAVADGAEETLSQVIAEEETGIVIIDERVAAGVPEDHLKRVEKSWKGIVLILPAPERLAGEVEDYAARLIRKAIGYHVRLSS